MEAVAIIFAGAAGIVALLALTSILRGWILSLMWGWFLVPLGLPALNIPTAIGLSIVAALLTHQHPPRPKIEREFSEHAAEVISAGFVAPLLILGIAWIVKQFL